MSITHYIQTKTEFDFEKLKREFSKKAPAILSEQRAENLCYFWQDKTSTRGVDISLDNGLIELRNTVMSSYSDLQLTNFLAHTICQIFEGVVYTIFDFEEDTPEDKNIRLTPTNLPLFSEEKIAEIQLQDATLMHAFITQQEKHITLFGPIRKTHFGIEFMNSFQDKTIGELMPIMHQLIKKVNYDLPNYEYGNVMQIGEAEETKILKLITNNVDCIIDKYDYILFNKNETEIIAITNDILNTILPASWQRIDEYTIVAPIVTENEFKKLVAQAEMHNQINELNN